MAIHSSKLKELEFLVTPGVGSACWVHLLAGALSNLEKVPTEVWVKPPEL